MTEQSATVGPLHLNESETKSTASPASFLILFTIVGVYVGARLWRLSASCLWFDELFGVHAARHDWKRMFQFVAADIIHPPLFYALLKLWIAIGGESLFWLRLLPVLLSIIALLPLVLLCRELRLTATQANLALALLAVNGYLIKYAQEIRMYSLLFLLTCTSLWLFAKFINARRNTAALLPALCACNLLLVYSHYYGWVLVIIELVALVIWWRTHLLKFALTIVALIVSYLPWLYFITLSKEPTRGLAQNIGWVTRPGLTDLIQFFSQLNIPFFFRQSSGGSRIDIWSLCLSLILVGLPLLILIFRSYRQRERNSVYWLLCLTLLPIVFVLALSWILPHSIWGSRHLIIVVPAYAILVAVAVTKLQKVWMKTACLVLLACWILLNGTLTLARRVPTFTWCTWEPLAQQMMSLEPGSSQPTHVYAFEDLIAYHLWFAVDGDQDRLRPRNYHEFRVHVIKGVPGLQEDPAFFLPRRFYEIETHDGMSLKGDVVWLAFRDFRWDTTRPPLSLIEAQGYETGAILETQAQGQKSFLVQLKRKGQTE